MRAEISDALRGVFQRSAVNHGTYSSKSQWAQSIHSAVKQWEKAFSERSGIVPLPKEGGPEERTDQ